MIDIVYKDKNIVLINKPVGLPSQADAGGSADAIALTADELRALGEPAELRPVHRLDRMVGGLLLLARTRAAAAELSRLFAESGVQKSYFAVTEGVPSAPRGILQDHLRRDPAAARSVVVAPTVSGAKRAELEYVLLARAAALSLVEVRLMTGRFHQIRAQFSSRALSLVGDKKYGSRDLTAHAPALFSHRLAFSLFGRRYAFEALPPLAEYPWSLFPENDYRSELP